MFGKFVKFTILYAIPRIFLLFMKMLQCYKLTMLKKYLKWLKLNEFFEIAEQVERKMEAVFMIGNKVLN